MGSLSNLYISQSYQSLIHLRTNNTASATLIGLEDGLGNSIGVSVNTAGNLYLSGTFSASLQEGYLYVGNSSGRTIAFPTSSLVTNINTGSLVTTSSFNQYTASTNIAIANINAYTQSNDQKWNNLAGQSGSWVTAAITGSSLVTASANLNTITFTKGDNSTFAIIVNTGSAATPLTSLNQFTQSQYVSNSFFATTGSNTFTDNQIINGTLNINSAFATSVFDVGELQILGPDGRIKLNGSNGATLRLNGVSTSGMNDFDIKTIDNAGVGIIVLQNANNNFIFTKFDGNDTTTIYNKLNVEGSVNITGSLTASLQQGYVWVGNANGTSSIVPTSSFIDTFNSGGLVTTSSFNQYTASTNIRLNNLESTSASVNIAISNINAYTQSNDAKWQDLGNKSGSWITESETGSFARYDVSNPWSANQTFTNIFATSASFQYVQTIFETASVIYSSGSNQFGDELTDTQTLSGSVKVQGSLTVNGTPVLTSSVDISSLNAYTASNNEKWNTLGGLTGSYATTGSNTFRGNQQLISSSITLLGSGQIILPNGFNLTGNQGDIAQISAATSIQFITEPPAGPGGSNDIKFINRVTSSAITFENQQSGSGNPINFIAGAITFDIGARSGSTGIVSFSNTPSINASNTSITASALNVIGNLTASLQQGYVWVGNASGITTTVSTSSFGSSINTGSFVTTSSFNQYTASNDSKVNQLINATSSYAISSSVAAVDAAQNSRLDNLELFTSSLDLTYVNQTELAAATGALQNSIATKLDTASFNQYTASVPALISLNAYTASNDEKWSNLAGQSGSWITESESGSFLITSSLIDTNHAIQFTKGDNTTYVNGGFAATGSANTFTSLQTFASGSNSMTLHPYSGSLVYTIGNIDSNINVSQSVPVAPVQRTGGNLLFKTFSSASGSLVISGSSNIVMSLPTVTAGFRSQLSSNNLAFAGINPSSSMTGLTNINNNIIQAAMSIRGPISSSVYTIGSNYLGAAVTLGTSAANHFERAVAGLGISNNLINGTINAIANSASFNTSFNIQNSNVNQSLTINAFSSSVQITNSNMGGLSATINNRASHSIAPGTNNFLAISSVLTSGQTTVINADGASATNVSPGVVASLIGGSAATIQLGSIGVTSDSNQLRNTIVFGNNLTVTGSNSSAATATNGSTFIGRWNADGRRNDSSYAVFAVGTGTAAATRKTGFLIDSGSNSFFEGTLNVSGSTTLSGSVFINNLQNGITANVVTYDTTTGELRKATPADILSASLDAAEFWSTTTQSGSAGVSGSVSFNNSGSVAGISVQNNTQLTVSQAGTYNIQFSAQVETSAGADTLWVWFKKNGVNISDSASKVVLANNTAQIMTVNIFDIGVANDYYEIAYQNLNGHARVLYEAASGNIPAIPSVILTIQQIR